VPKSPRKLSPEEAIPDSILKNIDWDADWDEDEIDDWDDEDWEDITIDLN